MAAFPPAAGRSSRTSITIEEDEEGAAGGGGANRRFSVRVIVHRGRNLLPKDVTGLSDPYLKITVGGVTKKTAYVDQTLDPDWNDENLTFPISSFDEYIKVEVWDKDVLSADDEMGSLAPIPVMSTPWWLDNSDSKQLGPTVYPVIAPDGEKRAAGEVLLTIRREPLLEPGTLTLTDFAVATAASVPVASFSVKIGKEKFSCGKSSAPVYQAANKRWEWDGAKNKLAIAISEEQVASNVLVTIFDTKKKPLGFVSYPIVALAENLCSSPSVLMEQGKDKLTRPSSFKIQFEGAEKTVALALTFNGELSSYRVQSSKVNFKSDEKRILRIQIQPSPVLVEYEINSGTKAIAINRTTTALQARDSILTQLSRNMVGAKRPEFFQRCQYFFLHERSSDGTKDRMMRTSELLWGVSPSSTLAFSEFSVSKQRSSSFYSTLPGTQKAMFGVDLEQIYLNRQTTNGIPTVVFDCMSYLRPHIKQVGLFRLSGNAKVLQQHLEMYNTQPRVSFNSEMIPDTAASLLKRFFMDLPDPLFPLEVYEQLIAISENLSTPALRKIIAHLSPERIALMECLFFFLHEIASHAEINMMTASNLGVCFGPTLIRSLSNDPMKVIAESKKVNDVVAFCIANTPLLFSYALCRLPVETTYQVAEKMGDLQTLVDSSGTTFLGYQISLAEGLAADELDSSPLFEAACARQRDLSHPHLLKISKIIKEGGLEGSRRSVNIWVIQEACHSTVVEMICRAIFPLSHNDIQKACRQLLQAVDFLHKQGLVHGSISSGTIMAGLEGTEGWILKLANPGSACLFAPFGKVLAESGRAEISVQDDLQAIGVFIYLLLTGHHLPENGVDSPEFAAFEASSKFAAVFIRKFFAPSPPSIDALLADIWFGAGLSLSSDQLDQVVTNLRTTVSLLPRKRKPKRSTVL